MVVEVYSGFRGEENHCFFFFLLAFWNRNYIIISLGILICLSWGIIFSSVNLTFFSNFPSHSFLGFEIKILLFEKLESIEFLGSVSPILKGRPLPSQEKSLFHVKMKTKRGSLGISWAGGNPAFYKAHCLVLGHSCDLNTQWERSRQEKSVPHWPAWMFTFLWRQHQGTYPYKRRCSSACELLAPVCSPGSPPPFTGNCQSPITMIRACCPTSDW